MSAASNLDADATKNSQAQKPQGPSPPGCKHNSDAVVQQGHACPKLPSLREMRRLACEKSNRLVQVKTNHVYVLLPTQERWYAFVVCVVDEEGSSGESIVALQAPDARWLDFPLPNPLGSEVTLVRSPNALLTHITEFVVHCGKRLKFMGPWVHNKLHGSTPPCINLRFVDGLVDQLHTGDVVVIDGAPSGKVPVFVVGFYETSASDFRMAMLVLEPSDDFVAHVDLLSRTLSDSQISERLCSIRVHDIQRKVIDHKQTLSCAGCQMPNLLACRAIRVAEDDLAKSQTVRSVRCAISSFRKNAASVKNNIVGSEPLPTPIVISTTTTTTTTTAAAPKRKCLDGGRGAAESDERSKRRKDAWYASTPATPVNEIAVETSIPGRDEERSLVPSAADYREFLQFHGFLRARMEFRNM